MVSQKTFLLFIHHLQEELNKGISSIPGSMPKRLKGISSIPGSLLKRLDQLRKVAQDINALVETFDSENFKIDTDVKRFSPGRFDGTAQGCDLQADVLNWLRNGILKDSREQKSIYRNNPEKLRGGLEESHKLQAVDGTPAVGQHDQEAVKRKTSERNRSRGNECRRDKLGRKVPAKHLHMAMGGEKYIIRGVHGVRYNQGQEEKVISYSLQKRSSH